MGAVLKYYCNTCMGHSRELRAVRGLSRGVLVGICAVSVSLAQRRGVSAEVVGLCHGGTGMVLRENEVSDSSNQ